MPTLSDAPGGAWFLLLVVVAAALTAALLWPAAGPRTALALAAVTLVAGVASREPTLALVCPAFAAVTWWWDRRGWLDRSRLAGLPRQAALAGSGFGAYLLGRVLVRGDPDVATENARAVIDFEKSLGLWIEHDVQRLLGFGAWGDFFAWVYSFLYHPIPLAALLVLYVADRTGYRYLRNALALSIPLGLLTILAFPVAPPRFIPELGIVDTVAEGGRERVLANAYAAIPSFHVGWLALVGFVAAVRFPRWYVLLLAPVPAVLMTLAVMATGNHYWVDPLAGTVLATGPLAGYLAWRRWAAGTGMAGRIRRPDRRTWMTLRRRRPAP
jgi:hypothetical protein